MRKFILFLTLILLIASACTTTKQDTMPDVGVPIDELNSVWFPKDDGARIYWVKNQND
jgi:hypothetical protein